MCTQISHKIISNFNTQENEFEPKALCYSNGDFIYSLNIFLELKEATLNLSYVKNQSKVHDFFLKVPYEILSYVTLFFN